MQHLLFKLQSFESYYPDKSEIRLSEARDLIEQMIGVKVDAAYVISFLREKGYMHIAEDQPKSGELRLNDIHTTRNSSEESPSAMEETEASASKVYDAFDLELDDILALDWQPQRVSKVRGASHTNEASIEASIEPNIEAGVHKSCDVAVSGAHKGRETVAIREGGVASRNEAVEGAHHSKKNSMDEYATNDMLLRAYLLHGEEDALEALIRNNERLVYKYAIRYKNYMSHSLAIDDLVSEGKIGLMQAIERFDLSKGREFSTYAVWWIRQRMTRAIFDTGTLVRIPVHMCETVRKIKRAEQSYLIKQQEPNIAAICEELDISPDTYERAKLIDHRFLTMPSLEQDVSDGDGDSQLGQFVSADTHALVGDYGDAYANPSLQIERGDVRERLQQALTSYLKPRERDVLLERFGFHDDQPKTLEQIGQLHGLTRERIRQIEAKALHRLRKLIGRKNERNDWLWPEVSYGV
ncbi:sigma-70 family RNA polymerase sigma factor [Numidum massiliense]|uniref:sigma-70 family RNA polymerase sigma factor n=1 Tax=Numidum massiliense TaxID=1522315 RepID=UPI0006D5A91E|nr:RNA polymerase sigma factor RpoD/SigA [Numidum massiliense]